MNVDRLDIQSFRCYPYTSVQFHPHLTVLSGTNAQGKTSILEALGMFTYGRSFRAASDRETIRFGEQEARLRMLFRVGAGVQEMGIRIGKKGKSVSINRMPKKNLSEFLGRFQAVVFTPDDLRLVKDGPEHRRRFLNLSLAQLRPHYVAGLQLYNRLLQQRNQLLKTHQFASLSVWDDQLAPAGARVAESREEFAAQLQPYVQQSYQTIAGAADSMNIVYQAGFANQGPSSYESALRNELARTRASDEKRGFTSAGPHRDDLAITFNGMTAAYASQGQQKTAVLAVKLAVARWIRQTTGEHPVLLLDDVLSELDLARQNNLLLALDGAQVILTLTHGYESLRQVAPDAQVLRVADGIILEQEG
ncbi:MAG: DNA replication/repair protein RecF [Sulfobacillus sp.]